MTAQTLRPEADNSRQQFRSPKLLVTLVAIGWLIGLVIAMAAWNSQLRSRWWILALAILVSTSLELVLERRSRSVPKSVAQRAGVVPQRSNYDTSNAPSEVAAPAPMDGDCLWIPKSSHAADETEDGWALDTAKGTAAVADGASSAYSSREWARILTTAFVNEPPARGLGALQSWIERCSTEWHVSVDQHQPGGESWWAGELEQRGSYATLLGVSVTNASPGQPAQWSAIAVGDSCLVVLRPLGQVLRRVCAFPLDHPEGFGSHPDLLATFGAEGSAPLRYVKTATGELDAGDVLLLMTDALAEWALVREAAGEPAWDELADTSADAFRELVVRERDAGSMVDDDVTLLRMRLSLG
jgi:hypothetical protein